MRCYNLPHLSYATLTLSHYNNTFMLHDTSMCEPSLSQTLCLNYYRTLLAKLNY